jgi:4-hydroxy-tetrahydrodipicolinate reductase
MTCGDAQIFNLALIVQRIPAAVRAYSVRLPSFVVSTEVVFGGPGERLIMRHDPGLTPAPYVAGTLLAVRHVADVTGVRRGLDSLLFGEHTPDPGP